MPNLNAENLQNSISLKSKEVSNESFEESKQSIDMYINSYTLVVEIVLNSQRTMQKVITCKLDLLEYEPDGLCSFTETMRLYFLILAILEKIKNFKVSGKIVRSRSD